MLAKIGAAFLHRRDDRGEVVVGQHHVGRLLRHVGAGDAHRHADVGGLQRGRIVHAVAGHGDDRAARLQRLDDAQLVLGIDARVDRHLAHRAPERVVGHLLELRAGDRTPLASDAELRGDDRGGGRMVAGDHDRADARRLARARTASFASARGGSIMPTRPSEHQLVLEPFIESSLSERSQPAAVRKATPSVRSASPASASLASRIAARRASSSGLRLVADQLVRAARQQDVGRALGEDAQARLPARRRYGPCSSACARRRTGTSPTRGKRASSASSSSPALRAATMQRAFGRVALHRPAAVALLQHGVVGAIADGERALELVAAPSSSALPS